MKAIKSNLEQIFGEENARKLTYEASKGDCAFLDLTINVIEKVNWEKDDSADIISNALLIMSRTITRQRKETKKITQKKVMDDKNILELLKKQIEMINFYKPHLRDPIDSTLLFYCELDLAYAIKRLTGKEK